MSAPASWRGVVKAFNEMPERIQKYFPHVPKLVEDYPLDVCLAYQFSRLELAHTMAIYCGVVKLHRVFPELVWTAVEKHHMSRPGFQELYKTVYGNIITKPVRDFIDEAETVRDKIMHGKTVTEAAKRKAVVDVLKYAKALNERTYQLGGLKPFGDLRGFKGRAKALDKSTSRWILRGMRLGG